MLQLSSRAVLWGAALFLGLGVTTAGAQPRVQFPQSAAPPPGSYPPPGSSVVPGNSGLVPSTTVPPASVPPTLSTIPPGAAASGVPAFDPYSAVPGAVAQPPPYSASTVPQTAPGSVLGTPSPTGASPILAPPGQPYGTVPPFGTYPPGAIPPGAPQSLFPNGIWGPQSPMAGVPVKFLQGPRFRYSWVAGEDGNRDLDINDFDVSIVAALPNFLGGAEPLFLAPSFSWHLWDGPKPPNPPDLPAQAYSAFLDAGWSTDRTKPASAEVGVRFGAFSDFDTFNHDSWRIMGQGLGHLQLTPTTELKAGVIYADRNNLKLMPAGGILWIPNDRSRLDIYFPKPKGAFRISTVGTQDVWFFIEAEYGGGAWTITRQEVPGRGAFSDDIDINDIRVGIGLEWGPPALLKQGRRTGFFEAAWVTSRQVRYVVTPDEGFDPGDSFMLRAGIGY